MDRSIRVARAAGILEGEGSFYTRSKGHTPKASCQMSDKDVILELQILFGGNIYANKVSKEYYKPTWTWNCSGETALKCMLEVREYMFARRREAIDKAIRVWEDRVSHLDLQRDKADEAAKAWIDGEGSLRELAKKYGVGYESIRRHANGLVV